MEVGIARANEASRAAVVAIAEAEDIPTKLKVACLQHVSAAQNGRKPLIDHSRAATEAAPKSPTDGWVTTKQGILATKGWNRPLASNA